MCATSFSVTNFPTLYSFVISEKSINILNPTGVLKLTDRQSGWSSEWDNRQNGRSSWRSPPNGSGRLQVGEK